MPLTKNATFRQLTSFHTVARLGSVSSAADELHLTVDAVKTHLRVLFIKFEIAALPQNQKRARLVELALERGNLSDRDLAGV